MDRMDQQAFHQMMLDRVKELEEAVERAEKGEATEQDWIRIRYECGLGAKNADRKSK